MDYGSLIVERTDAVATIRLNRPEKHNALNAQLCHELIDALDTAAWDRSVGVIVLTGAGPTFCAGLNLKGDRGAFTARGR